ncbi:hypothetical protein D3C75_626020 [compost metagenome]
MAGILTRSGFRCAVCGTADLLKIFVIHAVPQIIAHFLGFVQIYSIVIAKLFGPVHSLYSTRVSISSIRISPLCRRGIAFFGEQAHEAFIGFAE